jgi:3-oxoacyl-[acyl-carrier-protein] synthase-1
MVGVIAGSGGASPVAQLAAADIAREKGAKRIGPYAVTKTMGSTVSACLGTALKTKGVNYSITSACSTSAHCIGQAAEIIQQGKQNIIIAGGGEDEHWTLSTLFDAMGALSSRFNDTPELASRPFDEERDGFVISGGAGILIIEEEEHAKRRGAQILAEITGYSANSDGFDMVSPSGEGAERCMKAALKQHGKSVDYINAHGTSTPVGDIAELNAITKVFREASPMISSTKSMTGHSLGATGAQEIIYSLLMMQEKFIAPSINIENEIAEAKNINIIKETVDKEILSFMSNSFGFGGTNASLILQKY